MGIFGNDDNNDNQHDDPALQQSVDNVLSHDAPDTNQPSPSDNSSEQPDHQPHAAHSEPSNSADIGELASIKQQALKELSPLVGHLDQSPEEKFHTTMMMLQATDDKSLVKAAYEAAQNISDDKAKAQALLDLVNEINYFTKGE